MWEMAVSSSEQFGSFHSNTLERNKRFTGSRQGMHAYYYDLSFTQHTLSYVNDTLGLDNSLLETTVLYSSLNMP